MSWISARVERLRFVVAECLIHSKNPNKVGFADFVLNICATQGLTPQTSKQYVDTLIKAWNYNQWKTYIRNNPHLTKELKEKYTCEIKYGKTYRRANDECKKPNSI